MIKAIPMEDWLRGCIYHDGRSGYVTLPTDKVHQIANYIQRTRRSGTDGLIDLEVVEADRKTEQNCSVFPNSCETCRFELYCPEMCEGCCEWDSHYEPKTEPLNQDEPRLNQDEPTIVKKYDTFCGVPMAKAVEVMQRYKAEKTEPQTEDPPMDEYYKDHDELYDCDRYVVTNDEGERAYNCIGCERTDCAWK